MPPARDRSTPARRHLPALIVHGGAGADPADALDEVRDGIRAAVAAGWRVFAEGGRSLDAVEAAVRVLDVLKESEDPGYAARVAVDLLVEQGRGEGGLILLDAKGRMGYAQSTPFMPVGWREPSSHEPQVPF